MMAARGAGVGAALGMGGRSFPRKSAADCLGLGGAASRKSAALGIYWNPKSRFRTPIFCSRVRLVADFTSFGDLNLPFGGNG